MLRLSRHGVEATESDLARVSPMAKRRSRVGAERAHEDELRGGGLGTVAAADAPEASGVSDTVPVGGAMDGVGEARGVDEGLHQPHPMAESSWPVRGQAPLAQRRCLGGLGWKVEMVEVAPVLASDDGQGVGEAPGGDQGDSGEIVLDDGVGHQGGAGYGGEYLSDDQMMANLPQEGQSCGKDRLIFELNTHMIAVNEILDG